MLNSIRAILKRAPRNTRCVYVDPQRTAIVAMSGRAFLALPYAGKGTPYGVPPEALERAVEANALMGSTQVDFESEGVLKTAMGYMAYQAIPADKYFTNWHWLLVPSGTEHYISKGNALFDAMPLWLGATFAVFKDHTVTFKARQSDETGFPLALDGQGMPKGVEAVVHTEDLATMPAGEIWFDWEAERNGGIGRFRFKAQDGTLGVLASEVILHG